MLRPAAASAAQRIGRAPHFDVARDLKLLRCLDRVIVGHRIFDYPSRKAMANGNSETN
jgi:hypothetical protein